MRRVIITAGLMLAIAAPAHAEGLIRKRLDNALNGVEGTFGNDSVEHEVRTLSDKVALRDEEISKMLDIIAQKAVERQAYADELALMGVATPEPIVVVPPAAVSTTTVPADNRTCLTTFSGTPISCW